MVITLDQFDDPILFDILLHLLFFLFTENRRLSSLVSYDDIFAAFSLLLMLLAFLLLI